MTELEALQSIAESLEEANVIFTIFSCFFILFGALLLIKELSD